MIPALLKRILSRRAAAALVRYLEAGIPISLTKKVLVMLLIVLRYIWRFLVDAGRRNEGGSGCGYPIRWNLIVIAALIAALSGSITFLTYTAIQTKGDNNQFIVGALIGLLPTGIAALAGLGTTLMNEGSSRRGNRGDDS